MPRRKEKMHQQGAVVQRKREGSGRELGGKERVQMKQKKKTCEAMGMSELEKERIPRGRWTLGPGGE